MLNMRGAVPLAKWKGNQPVMIIIELCIQNSNLPIVIWTPWDNPLGPPYASPKFYSNFRSCFYFFLLESTEAVLIKYE